MGYSTAARVFRKTPLNGSARTVHTRKVAVGIIRVAVRHVTGQGPADKLAVSIIGVIPVPCSIDAVAHSLMRAVDDYFY